MRALTIVYILLACTVAGYTQTTATYDNVRARQQLTLNGHTLTSVLQTIDSLSTHAQGVTAKAVYDYIATKYSTVSAGIGIDVVKAGSNYTISLDTLKRLHFRTDSTYTGGVGTMRWNLTDGTLDLGLLGGNVTLQLGQESVQRVKHADNSGLVQGRVVYLVGSDGTNPTVRYARANTDLTSANTFGVMTEDANGGSKVFCTTFGLVRNINTNNLTEGGLVWLSKDTAGAMTAVRPTAPNHGIEIGFCIRKHATQGVVFVTVQNGYELNELHDVYAPSPSNNQGLLWKSANSRWEAAAVDTSLTNEGRLTGFKPSNNSYYQINSSTNGSSPIILYRGSGIGFSGTSGSPEGGDLTISNTGDLDSGNEGILGVGAGTSTSSVITSNTSSATGVTINATEGISISETTSSNGGSITLSATDQSVSNEGILGVAINPGADAWLRSNTSTANDIGLIGTNNTTINATANSNGGQIIIDSKAKIDTFSLSGQTLRASLLNDGVAASSVTIPVTNVTAGTGISVSSTTGNYTVTNSAPDQTVSISNGGGITPSGTYPNFTLTATDQSVTNEIQRLDTFSLSGQTLRASLLNDGVAASSVTLPIVDVVAGTNVTVSKVNGVATVNATGGGGGGTPAGSTGEIQYNNAGAFGASANLAWDNTNVRLNIGAPSSPTGKLNVKGSGTLTTVNTRLTNSGDTELLKVLDNGNTNIGTGFNWDNANGRLGLGTSSPSANLSISSAYAPGNTLAFSYSNSSITRTTIASSGAQTWYLNNGSGSEVGRIAYATPNSNPGIVFWTGSTYDQNRFNINNVGAHFTLGYNPVFNFNIFQSGNILINNSTIAPTDPNYRLDIVSTGASAGGFRVTGAGTSTLPTAQFRASDMTVLSQISDNGKISYLATNTAAGTTGAQTINRPSGTVNFAAGATSLVVTNSLCTTASIVLPVIRTNDATATIKNVVPAAGSFTINLGAAATAETSVGFFIIN